MGKFYYLDHEKPSLEAFWHECNNAGADAGTRESIFDESSWGISFAFDIAFALWAYLVSWGVEEGQKEALTRMHASPIRFSPGLISPAEIVTPDDSGEYTISNLLYENMIDDRFIWKKYFDLLLWFCEEGK